MKKIKLTASKRTILGRKVKKLRREGILPANIYGKKTKSLSIQIDEKDFSTVFAKVGETALVEIAIDKKALPVLIHNVQIDPVTSKPLHVDFLQVDLKKKIIAKVPLEIVGEAQVVKDKVGTLLTLLSEVEVETLPDSIPSKIEVDISSLSKIDQAVKVGQLSVAKEVKILTNSNLDIVKIIPLVSKEAEQLVKEEEEKAEAAASDAVEEGKEVEKEDKKVEEEKKED